MKTILDKWKTLTMHNLKYRELDEACEDFGFRLIAHIVDAPDCLDMDFSKLMTGYFYDYMTIECGIDKEHLQEKTIEFFNDAELNYLLQFYAVPYKKYDISDNSSRRYLEPGMPT